MSQRMLLLILSLIAGIIAMLLMSPPQARADNLSYLEALRKADMTITDTKTALQVGYSVCAALDRHIEMPANKLVTIAVNELCPWHGGPVRT